MFRMTSVQHHGLVMTAPCSTDIFEQLVGVQDDGQGSREVGEKGEVRVVDDLPSDPKDNRQVRGSNPKNGTRL